MEEIPPIHFRSKKYIEDTLKRKIDESKEEIEKCDPFLMDTIISATTLTTKAFERKIFNENEYDKYMKDIKKLPTDFRNKCYCLKYIYPHK